MIYGTRGIEDGSKSLSLCEIDDLRRRVDDRFGVLPFHFLNFSESPLKVLDLFLDRSRESEIRRW